MRKLSFTILLLGILLVPVLASDSGFGNLSFGVIEGTRDIAKVVKTPVEVNYLKSAFLFTGTVFSTLLDRPVFDYFSEIKTLKTIASVFSKSVEPVSLGILYTTLGWNNKQLARKIIGSSLFTQLSVNAMKYLVGKARPFVSNSPFYIGPNLKEGYNSFPSAHTAQSFNLATILSSEYPKYRGWFYAWSSSVGLSRIILQRHWISDVFGGAILGVTSAEQYLKAIGEDQ